MREASTGLGLRSLRIFSANSGYYGRSLTSSVQRRLYANQRAEDSSASNLGAGEPPIDENQTERGVSRGQTSDTRQNTSAGGTGEVGRHDEPTSAGAGTGDVGRHDEPTSTSKFDSGASSSPAASPGAGAGGQTKKSRTGSDMSDDGQVHTPHLGKMRTTRDMIHDKGRETEERLARSGTKHT